MTASKLGYMTVAFGQRRASDRGDIVTVAAGATVEHIDIVLPRGGVIAGRITDENGDPVENTAVGVWQIKFSAGRRRLTACRAPRRGGPTISDATACSVCRPAGISSVPWSVRLLRVSPSRISPATPHLFPRDAESDRSGDR